MTCVVGLAVNGAVHLGGDSIAIDGYSMEVRSLAKVFRRGAHIIGCAGSFRMADVIRYHFAPPTPPEDGPLHRYMAVEFVESLREALRARGISSVENNVEDVEGAVMVGVRGSLFVIESDFQVGEPACGYAAIGCGSSVARGALYATPTASPRARLTTALSAAEASNAGVRGPFHFVTLRQPAARQKKERPR